MIDERGSYARRSRITTRTVDLGGTHLNLDPDDTDTPRAQVAVWYFVAATFVFAAPALLGADAAPWWRITSIVVGFVLIVAGGVQLGREMTQRRDAGAPRSSSGPPDTH